MTGAFPVIYGGEPRALKRRVERILDGVRRLATRAGCAVEKLCFEIRDALDYLPLPDDVERPTLLAYARSLLSIFCWTPERPIFFASYETIMNRLGLKSVRGAIDVIARLIDARILVRVRRTHRTDQQPADLLERIRSRSIRREDRPRARRLLARGLHAPGEARCNVYCFSLPRAVLTRYVEGRPLPRTPRESAKTTSPSAAQSPATASPPPSPAPPPPPRVWTAGELDAARRAVLALPCAGGAIDPIALLEGAADSHPGRALAAVELGLKELSEQAHGWGRAPSAKEALSFVTRARLAAEPARPAKSHEAELRQQAREIREAQRHAAESASVFETLQILKGMRGPP